MADNHLLSLDDRHIMVPSSPFLASHFCFPPSALIHDMAWQASQAGKYVHERGCSLLPFMWFYDSGQVTRLGSVHSFTWFLMDHITRTT